MEVSYMAKDCNKCRENNGGYCEKIRKEVREYDTSRDHEKDGCDE